MSSGKSCTIFIHFFPLGTFLPLSMSVFQFSVEGLTFSAVTWRSVVLEPLATHHPIGLKPWDKLLHCQQFATSVFYVAFLFPLLQCCGVLLPPHSFGWQLGIISTTKTGVLKRATEPSYFLACSLSK